MTHDEVRAQTQRDIARLRTLEQPVIAQQQVTQAMKKLAEQRQQEPGVS